MRQFFDVGDIQLAQTAYAEKNTKTSEASKIPTSSTDDDDDDMPSSAPAARSYSAYKGASVEARRAISDEIVSRAKFLLRMGSKSLLEARSPDSTSKKSWKVLSKLTRQKSYNENGARWQELV